MVIVALLFISCSKDNDGDDEPDTSKALFSIELSSDKTTIFTGDENGARFTIKFYDESKRLIQIADYELYANDKVLNSNVFKSNETGEYAIKVKKNEIISNTINITVIDPSTLVSSITLDANTKVMVADGKANAILTYKCWDVKNQLITNVKGKILVNTEEYGTNKFSTVNPGTYQIKVKVHDIESNTITLQARRDIPYNIIEIPVVFHIVHFGEQVGTGVNISDEAVSGLLEKLNDAYSNKNGSTNPNAVDTKVRFRFAKYDINNKTLSSPGINRINGTSYDKGTKYSTAVDIANDKLLGPNESWELSGATFWNPRQYFNIWIMPRQFGQSSANYPRVYSSNPLDGLSQVPATCECTPHAELFLSCTINTASASNKSTLVHEVGHSLGLHHVFSTDNCITSDYCNDTFSYIYQQVNKVCSDNLGSLDQDNYMDYGGSYNTFTYDQRTRIQHVLQYGLWVNELKHSTK